MLVVNNIEVCYSQVILVLKGVSLEVPGKSIIALLGANGGGKSTMLKAISGLLKTEEGDITDGSVEFEGVRIDHMEPEEIVKRGISQIMEGRMVFEHLTVDENLEAGHYVRRRQTNLNAERDAVFTYFPRLKDLRHQVSGYLSGGEQQMLVIGRALMAKPKLLLLDEPSMGLAPMIVEEIFNIVKRINKEQGASMLLVEQNAVAALSIAQHGYVMENGKIVLDGPADKLMDNPDVKEFYLGLSELGEKKRYSEVKHYKRRKRWLV
ncbi:MAG: ABC transporter ATP-binding protein [Chloroflexi bacterium]|nr:ABC transporter ATP-binding protein [Chloroflexota bacterium]MBM3172253.1 ABC transporter ATP-binding protein [Chloroflexota bacterium]MBM3174647.1 ABC transporter ATP-binding protein [Chloroflexota bacterium]MBM4450014.1 ABC transporter ATP-binding protein [Chloroflexota bacterium]